MSIFLEYLNILCFSIVLNFLANLLDFFFYKTRISFFLRGYACRYIYKNKNNGEMDIATYKS